MSAPRPQWLLKVIVGPHQGAEMTLHDGKTLVGSDDECDVVLHDMLVAPQHLELEISPAGLSAAPLGGRVFCNGKRIQDARQPVPAFAFLSLGGTHIVIGPAGEKWPLLSAADVPDLEKDVAPPPPEPGEEEKAGASKSSGESSEVAPAPPSENVAPAVPAQAKPRQIAPLIGIASGLLVLIVWGIIYSVFFAGKGSLADDIARDPLTRAQSVIDKLGLSESVTVEEAGGRVSCSGYVDNESRQRDLQAVLRATVPGIRTKIYNLEKITSSARTLLADQHLPLTVSCLSDGKLKVTGQLDSPDAWFRIKQMLLAEVPGVAGIEDGVQIRSGAPKAAVAAVSSSAPSPASKLGEPDPATGYLVTKDTIDSTEATVASIRADGDHQGYLRLSTGGVYFVGAHLPYGGTITQIDPNAVTLVENGETRILRQGDKAMKADTLNAATPPPPQP